MDYSQWHSSKHDDEPRDQERDLRVPGHGYWASIGPDARRAPGGWSWVILEFDGTDNHEEASGFAGDEQAAKQAVDDWEAAAISSQPARPDSPVTFFLTYWVPTQYGMGLDAAQVAVRLREAGWTAEAGTAERIARGEITGGDATDDGAVSVNDEEGAALRDLAYAIRKNAELFDAGGPGGEPITVDEAETFHVWVGQPDAELATHKIAEHAARNGHRCPWSGTPVTCHLDGPVPWQCPAGCYTTIQKASAPATGDPVGPTPDTGTMVDAIANREGWTERTLLGVLIDYLRNQKADNALIAYLEERAAG
jgi:hypothetical protein